MGRVAGDAPHLMSRCRSSEETSKTKEAILSLPKAPRGVNLINVARGSAPRDAPPAG